MLSEQRNNTELHALPQADGDPGDGGLLDFVGRRAIASSKCGPAFETPLAVDLARSLQAQALAAAGDTLNAIERRVLPDVFPAWQRLLTAVGVSPRKNDVTDLSYKLTPSEYRWAGLRQAVTSAIANAQSLDAERLWFTADYVLRATALQEVRRLAERSAHGKDEQGDPLAAEAFVAMAEKAAAYQRFVEGRA